MLSTPADPQPRPVSDVLTRLDTLLARRAAGVPWTELGLEDHGPDDRVQVAQARGLIQFRQGLAGEDETTARRAARVLRAEPGAPLTDKVWGLSHDPGGPDTADFSDVGRALDIVAEQIHAPARYNGGARHERRR